MKQKIVVEVFMKCNKCRVCAMKVAAGQSGVNSVQIGGESKNQVIVIGEGVDSVNLTTCLRKKVGSARLISVEQVKEEENKNKDNKDTQVHPTILPYYYPYYNYIPHSYSHSQPCFYTCEPVYCDSNPNCSIM